jgi:ribosomal-protein-alanine N-acetyltransferase
MFETDRLILRRLDERDIDAIFAMRSDPEVMRFIRAPQNRAETVNWLNLVSSRWESDRIGFCAIVEKQTGKFIGWCGLWQLKETSELEIGYAIAKEFWGKGFATEAARIFLRYAFEQLNPDKIVAVAEPENLSSRCVMEKLGMKFVRLGEFYNRELVQYAVSRRSWLESRKSNKSAIVFKDELIKLRK